MVQPISNLDQTALSKARQHVHVNVVKEKLLKGELAHSFSIKLIGNVEIVFYAAAAGYDAVLIDLEHSSFGLETTNQLSTAALQVGYVSSHGSAASADHLRVTPIVRVPANSSEWISRALDGGAQAVIVPHVKNAKEAENVVRYAKFAPLGERSATSGMPLLRYAAVPAKYANPLANEATLVICMIETEGAVELVE